MSTAVLVYTLLAVAFWLPAVAYVHRHMAGTRLYEQVMAGLVVALGWPLTVPALGLSRVTRHH